MMAIDYNERIPNNVDLADNRRLKRALENWQPGYLNWWAEMGPADFDQADVYLRTAISVDKDGWAHFGHVKMPDYRWGIFLAEPEAGRRIAFGAHKGEAAWQEVPGEHRATLRRLIVTQGDTEPASVEQQRLLGLTCPSLYDLRNLFQVNIEEGRHLWAMAYLLHAHFGRDGREEADALLGRRSGDVDKPRILGAFNEATPDWLSFFMFTFFTDRDGKYQLASLAESAFDPLARTCRFMLTEEAHHMFVGDTGIQRVVQRSCELMKEHDTDDVAPLGGVNLATIQRYLNFHFAVSIDLFGSEFSTNAANYFTTGLKGRYREEKIEDDHVLSESSYGVAKLEGDAIVESDEAALTVINERLRDDYVEDCEKGMARWNRTLQEQGIDFTLRIPHRAFQRAIGQYRDTHFTPEGKKISAEEWAARQDEWLPSAAERAHVISLMQRVVEPGKFAGWIAPPRRGINGQPLDFGYVHLS
ncbi:MAG: benzoyl-CoA 2,3-epoxidase subunit BoxB [Rhodospirillaceae bacterium]|nr:benzoyl-CoA 2,3-epoxidase subunit BoxB [Rhodospirillaceae bacterium]MBT5780849.1 benzoyl-CoA 2,3-epoxidase subunit BoxB [Rhodospirillaceae bacterium]